MPKITKKTVDSTQQSPRDFYLWDSELSGFGLKVTPTGRKVYLTQYRLGGRGGRTRRVTIGTHGNLTTDQARYEAQAILRQVARGEDPAAARDKKKQEKTTTELLERFLIEHADTKLKNTSCLEYRRLISKLFPSALLNKPITEIDRTDMFKLHHSLCATPYQANRLLAVLSKFFNWCEKNGFRADYSNPTYHVDKFKEEKRRRYLSADEFNRLNNALAAAEKESLASPFVIAAIRLLILTGARSGEIRKLHWSEVDMVGNCLRLEDSKTGAKTIFLSSPAVRVFENIPRIHDNPFVICGEKEGRHLVNIQKPWRRIRSLANLDDVRIHDLRHSFASVAVANGMSLPLIGALLGHSQPQTTARYAHLATDSIKSANEIVGEKLQAMNGSL